MSYKYTLAKKGKTFCPRCERKTFVLYIDTQTGKPLNSEVGKCDRADNCDYHYPPKQYFTDNRISARPYIPIHTVKPQPKKQVSYIDIDIFNNSLNGYSQNKFVQFLIDKFGEQKAVEAMQKYCVGTIKNGGTVFWQMDTKKQIHTGKIITYGTDGHRKHSIPPQWAHKALHLNNFELEQCLFGLHLITPQTQNIGIVEAEKTAVIASIFFNEYVWVATGGKSNFSLIEKAGQILKGKKIVLFPDLRAMDDWKLRADKFKMKLKIDISVSELLEQNATEQERAAGLDLADYLVKNDLLT